MYQRYWIKNKRRKAKSYSPREKEYNFLKNWRVVRYYIQKRYDLQLTEIELLLYLYDENLFTKEVYNEITNSMSWDKNKFSELKKRGLIEEWRERINPREKTLYTLSQKAKLICSHTYKKLVGEETISEDPYRNKIMKGSNYMDKIYRNLIKKMNYRTNNSSRNDE